ncbi:MAG: acyl-CoA dehydrogenase family protein, partial [Candidatus Syntropharchaeia archaeon]
LAIVFAKEDEKNISAFIVETNTDGFYPGEPEEMMGLHGLKVSDITLEDVRIPKENRLGEKGKGFRMLVEAMSIGKMNLSAACVGICDAAIEEAVTYAKQRVQLGRPIATFQSIQWMIANMATKTEAARWMTYRTAFLKDEGKDIVKESAMTKLFASEVAVEVTRNAIQIHGSYGYTRDFKVERLYRDAKAYELTEGTSEIQRALIAPRVIG